MPCGLERQKTKPVMLDNSTFRLRVTAGLIAVSVIAAMQDGASAQSRAAKEAGVWYDDTGKGAVEIYPCADKLCGRIVWLKEPVGKDGQPLNDGYNPNPSMRSRTICGLQILGNLARQSDGTLDGGWVYDPKVGKSYDAAIALEDRNNLTLTGYKGVKLLSKSFTWTRAPANLPSCNVLPASAPAGTAKPAPAKPTAAR